MNVNDAIEKRRSIRKYKDISIEKDKILEIINAGRFAPSAKNRQPWYFVVVNNEIKNKIAELMINFKQEKSEEGDYKYSSSISFTGNVIKDAPSMILIYTYEDSNYLISDTLSVGAAIENMILRATELSLGTLWVRDTTHIEDEINKLVNIHDKKLSSALLIGIPDQDPKMRPREDLNDIVKWL